MRRPSALAALSFPFLSLAFLPAAACAAPPAAIEREARARVVGAATEGMTPEEAADPETVPAWMKQTKPGMFRKVDINGDRLADWLVDYERAPNASFFCGTGGCRRELYLGRPDGTFRKVYSHTSGELKFTGPRTARGLEVNFHGSVCGSFGADECLRAYRWDGAADRYVETPNSKGLALLAGGPNPAIIPPLNEAPPEVRADVALRRKACEAAGASLPDAEAIAYDIPDFNGDGRRDWVVGSSYDDCRWESERTDKAPPVRLLFLASRPDGGFGRALETSGGAWDMDIAASPARVILVENDNACGLGDKPCPRRPLTWDPASATLRP
ncbi:MAG TPA: hypothetical protein VEA44_00655 [Caulobacter sp.]|nr:hypothetical protein [Caulobacter sp.]